MFNESNIFGVSIRAYIVFMMVTAFVVMNFMKLEISETFATLVVSVVMFYFGNKPLSDAPKFPQDATQTPKPTEVKV